MVLLRAEAQSVPKAKLYGLSCPGQRHLISSDRQQIDKLGRVQSRFPTLAEETEFHKNRIKQQSGQNAEYFEKTLERARTRLIFRDGIEFDPINLGLPKAMNGCDVVPIIVTMNDKLVVSNDAWSKLVAVDMLISQLIAGSKWWQDQDQIFIATAFLLDDASPALTLKQYHLRMRNSLVLEPGISFRGTDYIECEFWSENIPSQCGPYYGQFNQSLGVTVDRKVTFWPDGAIASAYLNYKKSEVLVPLDLKDPSAKVLCRMVVFYSQSGKLTYCPNTFRDEKSNTEIISNIGRDTRTSVVRFVLFQKGTVFNDLEIPRVPSHRIVPDLGDQCRKGERSPLLVEFHPSGHFKSGITINKSTKKFEYLEVDDNGKITKLAPYSCRDERDNYYPLGDEFVNLSDKEIVYTYSADPFSYITEFKILFGKPGCISLVKNDRQQITHVKVGPQCFVFARILGAGHWH
ncbi:hypothetical protein [Bdellovibrio sp. HCB2-146]|uniref:hypothetical protein n=1 Tax=Bdellovibrio sp. HCB2-146 TaxID=3394362 RepID=UPI0039BC358D